MNNKEGKLERELKEFLNQPHNRIMRGLSKLTVFSVTCYGSLWGIVSYINYTQEMTATPLIAIGAIVAGYTASKAQGYLYNKVAESDFKRR